MSQITLINGEKIWVREEKGPSWNNTTSTSIGSSISTTSDDCNSSTDSINICVPLFVSTCNNQVSELDLSSEMLDLTCLLNSSEQLLLQQQTAVQVFKPQQQLVNDRFDSGPVLDPPKPGNSLLRSALTGKTSYLMSKQQLQNQQSRGVITQLPTFKPGLESSKIGEQKVEEILLLAKKRSLENNNNNGGGGLTITATSNLFQHSDKLVINTANLLNTAASQLNLAPPSLSSLVPVRNHGDSNNNIKTIPPPPASVISLVVDVGNNNNGSQDHESDPSMTPPGGAKKRILKRQKSNSSSCSNNNSPAGNSAQVGPTFISSFVNDVASQEPRKEARLMHYCPICNKGFKDRYSVNVHVRTHTGEKPFSCAICGKCFRQKAHLAKHHQTHAAKQTTILPNVNKPNNESSNSPPITQQPPQMAAPPMSAVVAAAVAPSLAGPPSTTTVTSVAGNSNNNEIAVENIVFPLSPVSVDIMDQS